MRALLLMVSFLCLSAFTQQPMDERKLQEKLPVSGHPLWQELASLKVTEDNKTGMFNAVIPPNLQTLKNQDVTVDGFMLPLESTTKFKHFLLSKRTPTCPFCPPGKPNEVIDVWASEAIDYEEGLVSVQGSFSFMNDREMGLFFKIKNALVRPAK